MPALKTASGTHSLSVAATAAAAACVAAAEAASRKGAGANEASVEASEGMLFFISFLKHWQAEKNETVMFTFSVFLSD